MFIILLVIGIKLLFITIVYFIVINIRINTNLQRIMYIITYVNCEQVREGIIKQSIINLNIFKMSLYLKIKMYNKISNSRI